MNLGAGDSSLFSPPHLALGGKIRNPWRCANGIERRGNSRHIHKGTNSLKYVPLMQPQMLIGRLHAIVWLFEPEEHI